MLWVQAIWNSQTTIINSFDAFSSHYNEVFGLSIGSLSIADQLICLRQGDSSASDFTLQFRTLAASCGWNKAVLLTAYRQGLDPQIRAQMAIYDENVGLESFMQKAVKISQRLTTCQPDITDHSPSSPAACPPVPEVDTNLTMGLCFYCGVLGHFIWVCPSHPLRPVVSTLQLEPAISTLPLQMVQLLTPCH